MLTSVAGRVVWAVLSALVLGAWLYVRSASSDRTPHVEPERGERALRAGVLILCAAWSAVWLALALKRWWYPFELEWIGGALRDHCERALTGKSLYPQPGPDFIPYGYTPLYFWVSAAVMRF